MKAAPLKKPVFTQQYVPVESKQKYADKTMTNYSMPMAYDFLPAWKDILIQARYPQAVLVLDFETYFDSDFHMGRDKKALSTIEYVTDRRFEVVALARLEVSNMTNFPDYENQTYVTLREENVRDIMEYLKLEYGQNLEKCTVVMQNAAFDGTILAQHYDINPPYVIDTLGLARHWNPRISNKLEDLAQRFKLPAKGDTKQFKEYTYRIRVKKQTRRKKKGPNLPERIPFPDDDLTSAMVEYAGNDVMREWELFTLLLPKLSNPVTELRAMQHTLDLFWKPVLQVDYAKAEELKTAMEAEINQAIAAVPGDVDRSSFSGGAFDDLMYTILETEGYNAGEYTKPSKGCKKGWKIACAKDDPERALMENHENETVRLAIAAKSAIDSWPLHIARVDRIVNQCRAAGHVLPVPLKYCGAHTGRWSGGEKINLQNLGSRSHDLVKAVRGLLIPPPGHRLVIADASQIEARVLAWVAGETELCHKFANGDDVYCEFATKVLGYPVRKPKPADPPPVAARLKWARNMIGKTGVLGCGYGMGTTKIETYNAGNPLDTATADRIKTTYRDSNPKIVDFWHDLERAFLYVFKHGGHIKFRSLSLRQETDCDVIITLPNGRELKYHDVRLSKGKFDRDGLSLYNHLEHKWVHIWGGHLTENVVQAISRDILWDAVWGMEMKGYHVPHHVHDELIACVPEDKAEHALNIAIELLSTRPKWGPDLPLGAEGKVKDRYGDH